MFERERTKPYIIRYALYLYFLGLSFRDTSKAIQPFIDRSYVAIWKWVQRFSPKRLYHCKRISAFLIDETMLQIDADGAWL
jgi:transposase-like protein